jgi:transcriptional regulator with XRE-family HTH domain
MKTKNRQTVLIGRRIRALRVARGLTQIELAQLSSMKQSRVSNMERGHIATLQSLGRIVAALGAHLRMEIR